MFRRPFCGMALSFLLGILLAAYWDEWIWLGLLLAVAGAAVVALVLRKRRLVLRILLCVLMFGGGIWRYQEEQVFRAAYQPYLSEGMQLTVQGKLTDKQFKNNQYIYELSACIIMPGQNEHEEMEAVSCNHILVYSDSDVSSIGEILVLDGTVKLWESAVNEGNFDAKFYYESCKIDFAITDATIWGAYGDRDPIGEGLWELKLKLKDIYRSTMSEETCGVMTTMVLGDKELLDAEIKQLYQVGGLSHIMAISGLHISVIGMTLYRILRKSGSGFGAAGICAGVLMCLYGTMVGMGTSVQRALFMFLLQLLAAKIGRSYDTLNSLGMAAVFLLWENPYLLWNAGFQFSFAAIIGVAWVGRSGDFAGLPWEKKWDKLYVSVAIQLTTLPLVAWYYYEIPLYAIVMNLLILPMMGLLLGLGILGGFGGLIATVLAEVFLYPCQKLLELNEWLCSICAKLPGAMWITGRPEIGQVLFYYGMLTILTMWAYQKKRKRQEASGKNNVIQKQRQAVKTAVAVTALLIMICAPFDRGAELDILDVGQGDASFLRTGGGYTMFVDGGSSNISKVGEYRILPFLKYKGARRIDCWVVSHTDEDHISGLKEILAKGYRIERLIFSSQVTRDAALSELLELAEGAGTEAVYLDAGDVIYLGEASLRAVFPLRDTGNDDKNENSLVVYFEEGDFSGIFTGDIGTGQEQELAAWLRESYESWAVSGSSEERIGTAEEQIQVDFYKAAHHGSKYSNSAELLELLRPQIATISCAEKNSYGHPSTEAISNIEEVGCEIFYTMESGQITIGYNEKGIWVKEYSK